MKLWQKLFGAALIFVCGLASAQIVTDSKLHLLDETNPKSKTVKVKRAPHEWVDYCANKRSSEDWKNNDQLRICLDEIVTKHNNEITGVECQQITKMMTEGGTKRSARGLCKDHYGYDLCMEIAGSDLVERRKCLIGHENTRDVKACKTEVTKNFSSEFTPDMCDKVGAFDKFKKPNRAKRLKSQDAKNKR